VPNNDDQRRDPERHLQPSDVLEHLTSSSWYDVGQNSAQAHLDRKTWLFRRVESIEFLGHYSLRRHVSIDFEIPRLPRLGSRAPRGGRLVPVSVFGKWPPLMDFNLTGPDGCPISLYVRDTNKSLDFGLLIGMAKALNTDLSPGLKQQLARLVATDEPPAQAIGGVTAMLREELEQAHPRATLARHRQIVDTVNLAAQLANSSILWVPVVGTRGSDRIVKFSYLDKRQPTRSFRQFLIACSWHDRAFYIPLPHAGQHTRYHLDIRTPKAGVELLRARTIVFPSEPDAGDPEPAGSSGSTREVEPSDGRARRYTHNAPNWPRVPGSSEIVDRRVHIYHPARTSPSHRVALQLVIAATREGFISGCLIVAMTLALLMSAAYARLSSAAEHLDAFVVLLAAVPLVLGYLLVRTEDPLEREGIVGVRAMATLSGLVPIVGALSLVFSRQPAGTDAPTLSVARPVWAALTILSWLLVVGLTWSWALAVKDKDGVSRSHRAANIASISGALAAVCIAVGAIVEVQPYSHVPRRALASYLRQHQPSVVVGAALLGIGAIAVSALIGGVRRVRARPPVQGEGRIVFPVLMAAGGLWIWANVAATTLLIWQTITLHDPSSIGSFGRGVDAVMNASLIPAAILVATGTAWLLRRRDDLPANPHIVVLGGLTGISLIVLRGVSVLWPPVLTVSAEVAWLGFAAWVLCTAIALRCPLRHGQAID
jgi:hypothetical protein